MKNNNGSKKSGTNSQRNTVQPKGRNGKDKGNKPPYRKYSGSRQDRRAEEIGDTAAKMSKSNPVSFYDKFPTYARDASNVAFASVLGQTIPVYVSQASEAHLMNVQTPGLMTIEFAPSIGVCNDADSPFNRMMVNYAARLRQTQKAFAPYDYQDLAMAIIAVDSMVMFHELGTRIYGTLTDMSPINRFYPRALAEAQGVSYTQVTKEVQDFRGWLNQFAISIEQFAIPKEISYVQRHKWMCAGLYTDSDTRRAQTYMFVPTGFWKFSNTGSTGSGCVWEPWTGTHTLDEFKAFGDALIKALMNDDDITRMIGDLYAYYGSADIMHLDYVPENYAILPAYSPEVLAQIENLKIVGDWADDYEPKIWQTTTVNNGAVIFQPKMKYTDGETGHAWIQETILLNMHKDSPTSDDVIEATRLTADMFNTGTVRACGTELVQAVRIWFTDKTSATGYNSSAIKSSAYLFTPVDFDAADFNALANIIYLESFDWHPTITIIGSSGPGSFFSLGIAWDSDNYTVLPLEYYRQITQACLYSEFLVFSH